MLVGCEKKRSENNSNPIEKPIEYERTVWINPDVECCGVKDPLNNLGWLRDIYDIRLNQYKQLNTSSYEYIFLFKNDSNSVDYIVRKTNMGQNSWFGLYECNGIVVDSGIFSKDLLMNRDHKLSKSQLEEPADDCDLCEDFFNNHTLIDTIAYLIVEPKK
jgi:hypothetical protein